MLTATKYYWLSNTEYSVTSQRLTCVCILFLFFFKSRPLVSVGCASDWWSGGRGFDPRRVRQHSMVQIDHEIFSTAKEYAQLLGNPLRKHAYSNILKIVPTKNEIFQIKNSDIFHISAQNIDCGYSLEPPRWGGSNEYLQSMFWAEIRNILYTPVNPIFTYKRGFKGVKII